ncbi:SusD/RagB family nutrient-binding outer membrane lipoprotein [Rhodocaloribacter litoris]|nr:SusD/RagB family nutrient-binding outer membrane lipoprotein [Rhodocaloribacter litoris]
MKRMRTALKRAALLATAVLLLAGCDQDDRFTELNTNPTEASTIPPDFLFTTAELATAGTRYEQWRSNLIYPEAMIQHLAETWYTGDKYTTNADWLSALWTVSYNGNGDGQRAPIKLLVDLIYNNVDPECRQTQEIFTECPPFPATNVNKIAAARMLRVFVFQRLTDMYGDLPYFEAGMGFLRNIIAPRFDTQEEIYRDMLKELEQAVAQLDPAFPTYGSADVIYGGDVEKWRRFGNSLMLRLAMRLVKRDPALAQQWAQKAISGGLMQGIDDNFMVRHERGGSEGPNGLNTNGVGEVLSDFGRPKCTRTFVNHLKTTADPRLTVFCGIGGRLTSLEAQKGMPGGNDANTISDPSWPWHDPGFTSFADYSVPTDWVSSKTAPTFLLTYAEVAFLTAEAAVRWGIGGDPATHYASGVRASMQQLAFYEGAPEISAAEIDAYLAANPFDPGRALEQINTQIWITTFLQGHEAWANWRRSGYPVLEPVNWPGNVTGGRIPRRLGFWGDLVLNPNARTALERQGLSGQFDLSTPVWWDAP